MQSCDAAENRCRELETRVEALAAAHESQVRLRARCRELESALAAAFYCLKKDKHDCSLHRYPEMDWRHLLAQDEAREAQQ